MKQCSRCKKVCVIDEVWKEEYLPEVPLRDVSNILEAPNTLNLVAANGIDLPYIGYVEVTFRLSSQSSHQAELVIPMLVARGQSLSHPIIGFNVIEQIVNSIEQAQPTTVNKMLERTVKAAFPSLKRSKVQTFIHLVSAESSCEYIVKTTKVHVSIPKRSTVPVSCRVYMQPVKEDSTLIFEPDVNHQWPDGLEFTDSLVRLKKGAPTNITIEVYNDTDHDVTLMGQTPIGTLQFVKNVFPASMFEVPATPNSVGVCHIQTADNGHDNTSPDEWLPPVDVNHLDKHQRQESKHLTAFVTPWGLYEWTFENHVQDVRKIRPKCTLEKPQISQVESDDESEDEVDFHYVPPQVPQPNHVVEPESLEPLPTTESDEQPSGVLEQVPASMSSVESDQEDQESPAGTDSAEQEFNLPVDEQAPSPMSSPESDQEGQRKDIYQPPGRQRYPPRVLTYDELGTPTFNVRQLNGILQTPQQNLPNVSAHGLSTWLPPVQQYCYQLPFVYGVH
ncbi:uncharacterized protein LOC121887483 [Tachysurus ichikawai]